MILTLGQRYNVGEKLTVILVTYINCHAGTPNKTKTTQYCFFGLNFEVWVETVTEGGRRFMAAWRKEEVDAARHRQEKREATRLGTLLSQTGV